ncbi:MAG: YicC family protein [Alkaliphilus sp.]|nr:MAG: YicC family protein [Alkaliphilus sp.]
MLKSMTGFGRGESQIEGKKFFLEIKTLNNRYLDIIIRMPKSYTYLEERIRKTIKNAVRRGRVEVYIKSENTTDLGYNIVPNILLAKEYLLAAESISEQLLIKNDITLSYITKFPDVLVVEKAEEDEDKVWFCMSGAIENAINNVLDMRVTEGAQIEKDILSRLTIISELLNQVKSKSPEVVLEYKEKLSGRINELLDSSVVVDESRLATEVAFFADKSNIDEELVRFDSHIEQLKSTLNENDSIGRKLDFLLQEMNREVNTIGSKANHLVITNHVVKIKSELEKIREQVQNIE